MTRARDALRALRKRGAVARAARVRLRGGTYFLTEPLVFTSQDSGTARRPVIFEAFEGESPILSGGQRIGGWSDGTVHGRPCWIARMPEAAAGDWDFTQLFVNGVRRPRTRLPKDGYYRFAGVPDDTAVGGQWGQGPDAALFAGEEIRPWKNLDDVKLIALQLWFETHHRIQAVDANRRRVSFRAKSLGSLKDEKLPGAYARYFVENVFESLETPGEWYLDRPGGMLYYLPLTGESLETSDVIAPKLSCLIHFEGTDRKPVRHIRFENVAFHHAEWDYPAADPGSIQAAFKAPGAVVFDRAEDCVLYGCEIAHIAQYGVEMKTGCSGNRVVACTLRDMGAGGVRIGHEWMDRTNETSPQPVKRRTNAKSMSAVVSDCQIHDASLIHLSAIGVWIGNAGRNRILRNHIFNLNYTGISCGWTWGYAPTATFDNRIERNHIHHINWNRVLSDNGGIYTLGIQPGTVVCGNHIHHIGCYGYGGWGIYPDEGSSEILFEGNVVHHTDDAGFSTHYGRDNVVRNNVFALSARQHVNPGKIEPHRTTTFERNIVCWRKGGFSPREWRSGHFLFRDNLFWNGGGALDFGNGTALADWQKIGQHIGTLIADPLFVDIDAGDLALRADSPAFRIGFRPLDVSQAGPRFRGRRPVSFEDWPGEKECRRPIIRTRLERVGTQAIRVTVENVGNAPATGRLTFRASPPTLAAMEGSAAFVFRGLRSGASKSAEFPIMIVDGTERIRVETLPSTRDILPALQFFTLREPEWRISRMEPLPSAEAARAALAGQTPRVLTFLDRTLAEFRAAIAGGNLALSAKIADATPKRGKYPYDGSCIEIFSHDQKMMDGKPDQETGNNIAGIARQSFLMPVGEGLPAQGAWQDGWEVRAAPEIRIVSTATADGYDIAALLPLPLLRIAAASRRFGFELVIFTTLRKGSGLARFQLFSAASPLQSRDGCATVIVE
ncbi:MAG: right-handed parallel beta-helix repeat-containing protein [Verrucomicrobia bacterium]|nr:right-handed parallel beta-helix repeat-containing protein [Verrucomicrobiota bacterium]